MQEITILKKIYAKYELGGISIDKIDAELNDLFKLEDKNLILISWGIFGASEDVAHVCITHSGLCQLIASGYPVKKKHKTYAARQIINSLL